MMAFSWHGESPNTSVLNVCASLHRQSRSETSTRQHPARGARVVISAARLAWMQLKRQKVRLAIALADVVLVEALILAVLGFVPGLAASLWLYRVTSAATNLPMHLEPPRAGLVLGLTIVMCCVSRLVAMRKLRTVDPPEVF